VRHLPKHTCIGPPGFPSGLGSVPPQLALQIRPQDTVALLLASFFLSLRAADGGSQSPGRSLRAAFPDPQLYL
jgi:hypothetical protein